MINRPKEPLVWQALTRLRYNDDWNTVRKWLESERKALQDRNDGQLDDTLLRQGQGASLMLKELFKTLDESEDAIRRMKANTVDSPRGTP